MQHPIDNIEWLEVDLLDANDYNPNVVIAPEFKLLKLSLMKQGWIQPVLVVKNPEGNGRYTIVDGFHRTSLTKIDEDVRKLFGTKVPCAVLDISEAERKMLTVRINRAKGTHMAVKMHDLVVSLVRDHEISVKQLCEEFGAERQEIELLLQDNVFEKMDIASQPYSRAWGVKGKQ